MQNGVYISDNNAVNFKYLFINIAENTQVRTTKSISFTFVVFLSSYQLKYAILHLKQDIH